MKERNIPHPDLVTAQKLAYEPNGLLLSGLLEEKESQEYAACAFEINNKNIKFRVAKITPIKIGQFVTLWKRIRTDPIMPFDVTDPIDLFVVSVRNEQHLGQFVFTKNILHEKGFISKEGKGGKLAMRVYPPWDITNNPQAKKTQAWQLLYFFEIQPISDSFKLQKLFR